MGVFCGTSFGCLYYMLDWLVLAFGACEVRELCFIFLDFLLISVLLVIETDLVQ